MGDIPVWATPSLTTGGVIVTSLVSVCADAVRGVRDHCDT